MTGTGPATTLLVIRQAPRSRFAARARELAPVLGLPAAAHPACAAGERP